MNDTWHIPRASLSGSTIGSSSNSSSKSNSNPPTVKRLNSRHLTRHQRRIINHNIDIEEQINNKNVTATTSTIILGLNINDNIIGTSRNNTDLVKVHRNRSDSRDGNDSSSYQNNNYQQYYEMHPSGSSSDGGRKIKNLMKNIDNSKAVIKRGSRSSQGSTDSHSSSRSGSSGSLLLTAANLERFVAIHNKTNLQQSKLYQLQYGGHQYQSNITSTAFSQNPLGNVNEIDSADKNESSSINNNDTVLEIDPNLNFIKTKDVDTMSIASSTHFTMVNGVGGPQKKIRSGICSRGHQITVLILTMSGFFLIGILLMVYLMEMRAREMPQQ